MTMPIVIMAMVVMVAVITVAAVEAMVLIRVSGGDHGGQDGEER